LKYGLGQYLDSFIACATFPDKKSWRILIDVAIKEFGKQLITASLLQDPTLNWFYDIYGTDPHIHPVWVAESRAVGHKKHFRDLAKLNCVKRGNEIERECPYCHIVYLDQVNHFFHSCSKYLATRETYWTTVINACDFSLSAHLYNLTDEEITAVILGKRPCVSSIQDKQINTLLEIGAKVWQLVAYDPELMFY
jgi:hypothetical protein